MSSEHIEHRKGAAGIAMAYVGRSRVRVSDIARQYEVLLDELMTKNIQESYPHLTEEEIFAAIRYWRDHPDEISEEIERDEEIIRSLKSAG
jgi:uncharacterized protein (DUF433 family)